jgi:hypothetical protein
LIKTAYCLLPTAYLYASPDLKHLVHTVIFLVCPFTLILNVWRFGYQRRFVLLCAWLTLLPTTGLLPHISHTLDILLFPLVSYLLFCYASPHRHKNRSGLIIFCFPFCHAAFHWVNNTEKVNSPLCPPRLCGECLFF